MELIRKPLSQSMEANRRALEALADAAAERGLADARLERVGNPHGNRHFRRIAARAARRLERAN